jgi:hypothetical protein
VSFLHLTCTRHWFGVMLLVIMNSSDKQEATGCLSKTYRTQQALTCSWRSLLMLYVPMRQSHLPNHTEHILFAPEVTTECSIPRRTSPQTANGSFELVSMFW